jgi:hypothetical protein
MSPATSKARRTASADANAAAVPAPPASAPAAPFADASREARRLAAAVLEVLAGTQAPAEAAQLLGISQGRYYQLERQALAGLIASCEARRRGRGRAAGSELARLRQECERLRRECARQQALARAARRTAGLADTPPAPAATPAPAGPAADRPKRRRRPKARALTMAAQLREEPAGAPADGPPPVTEPADAPAPAPGPA